MMSSVTVSRRLSANIMSRCVCVLDSIRRNDDMQAFRNLARLVHNPRRNLAYPFPHTCPRRDYNRL